LKPPEKSMTDTSLDFSQKTDLRLTGEAIASVNAVTERLKFVHFIAGALARDLWLVHKLGIPVARQTNDADFAVEVSSWEQFHELRNALIDSGNYEDVARAGLHRLRHRNGIPIDLVPYGAIEGKGTRTIAWPPNGVFAMSVFGFREASSQTIEVIFPSGAMSRVVTLPALTVLKLDAWVDRHVRDPRKDAYDLHLIITNYAAVSDDRLYEANPFISGSPSDYECAGAWLLGVDMAKMLDSAGRARLAALIANEADENGQLRLAGEMMRDNPERALALLGALEDGFIGKGNEQ
jgi:predicted nucleotidyltransferase